MRKHIYIASTIALMAPIIVNADAGHGVVDQEAESFIHYLINLEHAVPIISLVFAFTVIYVAIKRRRKVTMHTD